MVDFQKKVGPLPIWGYGAIAAGAGAILFWRSRKAGAGATTQATTDPIIDPNTGVPYSQEYTGTESSPYPQSGNTYNYYMGSNPATTPAAGGTGKGIQPSGKPVLIPRIVAGHAIPPGYSLLHGVLTPNAGTTGLPSGWRWAGTGTKRVAIPPGYTLVSGVLKKAA